MIKKVAKNSKTSGKVYLPVAWVGKEVTISLNGENLPVEDVEVTIDKDIDNVPSVVRSIAERKTEATIPIEANVVKAKEEFHEKKPETTTEPEKKIKTIQPIFPIATPSGEINLNDLDCRTNQETCGRTGEAINDDICNACENPVCKYFYEKKNLCNKENKYVKCKGNLRACTIKQDVGKDIEK